MRSYVLDCETTLSHNRIRLANLYCPDLEVHHLCLSDTSLIITLNTLKEGDIIYLYNGFRFDIPVIKKVWDIDLIKACKDRGIILKDLYLLAKMIMPDRKSHSLKSFGEHFVKHGVMEEGKGEPPNKEWYDTVPLHELREYCEQDCLVTWEVKKALDKVIASIGGNWDHPLKIEQEVATITENQLSPGVHFDIAKARGLVEELNLRIMEIEAELEPILPVVALPPSKIDYPPKLQLKSDGEPSANMIKYVARHGWELRNSEAIGWTVEGVDDFGMDVSLILPTTQPIGPTTKKLKLKDQKELKEWLMRKGWKPTMWNTKKDPVTGKYTRTSPRLADRVTKEPCPNLLKVGFTQAHQISEWLMLRSRRNLLLSDNGTGLIVVAEANDGYIASDADTVGTPTARYRHRGIVNIPRVTSPYGSEFRSLFGVVEPFKQVGWDATSLEACMEGHYTFDYDGGEYAAELMAGDVHTKNELALGLKNRDDAKTFKYAVTYGAQSPKLAEQLGVDLATAQHWFDEFWRNNESLAKFKADLEQEWEHYNRRYIIGLDGRLIATRHKHALVNTKFQSAGALVMKHAFVLAEKLIHSRFNDLAEGMIRYHDEEQWRCDPDIADEVGKLGCESIRLAGEYLKVKVPLSAEYKIGTNWAETH